MLGGFVVPLGAGRLFCVHGMVSRGATAGRRPHKDWNGWSCMFFVRELHLFGRTKKRLKAEVGLLGKQAEQDDHRLAGGERQLDILQLARVCGAASTYPRSQT